MRHLQSLRPTFARKAKKRHSPSSGVFCVSDGAVRYGPRPLSWCFIGWITYESIPSATGLSWAVSHQVACEIFLSEPDAI